MQPIAQKLPEPVGKPIYNGGNPIVPLSPAGGIRNIQIIYHAIKNCDGNQKLRAGYTWNGRPYLEFVEKKKSHIGKIEAYNICEQRRELNNILANTADTALSKLKNLDTPNRRIVETFRDDLRHALPTADLRVRDVRRLLQRLDSSYEKERLRQEKTAALRARLGSSPMDKLNATRQRMRQFVNLDPTLRSALCNVLRNPEDDDNQVAAAALGALRRLLKRVLNTRGATVGGEVRKTAGDRDLQWFALRWKEFRNPHDPNSPTVRTAAFVFDAFPWCRLLDETASKILKAERRHVRVSGSVSDGLNNLQVVYRREDSLPRDTLPTSDSSTTPERRMPSEASTTDSSLVMSSPVQQPDRRAVSTPADSPLSVNLRHQSVAHAAKPAMPESGVLPLNNNSAESVSTTEWDPAAELQLEYPQRLMLFDFAEQSDGSDTFESHEALTSGEAASTESPLSENLRHQSVVHTAPPAMPASGVRQSNNDSVEPVPTTESESDIELQLELPQRLKRFASSDNLSEIKAYESSEVFPGKAAPTKKPSNN